MANQLDPYAFCPCGSGKKLKFCCQDLAGEITRIHEMLEGGQRAAALEHIESLEKKFPDRAYLVTTKALLYSILGQDDKAAATLEDFLSRHPGHPVALAEQAVVTATKHGALAGIQPLQRALEANTEAISGRVVAAVSRLGELLLMEGRVAAARGHFMLAYNLNPNDEVSLQLLARFFASPNIPLVMKNEQGLFPAQDVPWKPEFDDAVNDARRGLWWRAADKLKSLIPKADAAPELWRNLSVVRAWLGDNTGSITALRKLAAMDVPWDDAVEAEALAQIYDGGADTDVVDELRATVDVKNPEAANEVFASNKQFTAFRWESLGMDFGDQPPPRSAYFLLDRPLPASGIGLARQDVPKIIARILVFGRQTDREARLELMVRGSEQFAVKQALAALMPPDVLGPWPPSPEKIGDIPVAEASLSWSWRLPDDTPPAQIRQMLDDQRRDAVLNVWTQTPQQRFGGKTPAEAAGDAQYRLPLAGAVLLIELSFSQASTTAVFDELRTQLGIQPPAVPDMATAGPLGVPYTRLHRLDAPKLSDDDLVMSFQRALQVVARQAVRKLGLEVVGRASLKGKIDLAGVYGHLADLEEASDDAIRYIDLARKAAEEQKQSTAPWDLEEVELRLRRGEPEEFGRLVEHIQSQHIREPGVAQALMQLLYQAGVIGPDGRPRGMPGGGVGVPGVTVPGAAMPASSDAGSGGLWTPDGGGAPAAGGGQKSGLWVPGMD
ncbi:MAG: hypothetical protein J0M17_16970 [Planctomycetes bacterium]|nr:hypothetical protein [Planctomycetota bacterium]